MLKIAKGTLVYSKVVKKLKNPLETPKKRNNSAGKQQIVDKSAVKTAPIITKLFCFIKSLEKYNYIQKFLVYSNLLHPHLPQHKDNLTYLMDIELVLELK